MLQTPTPNWGIQPTLKTGDSAQREHYPYWLWAFESNDFRYDHFSTVIHCRRCSDIPLEAIVFVYFDHEVLCDWHMKENCIHEVYLALGLNNFIVTAKWINDSSGSIVVQCIKRSSRTVVCRYMTIKRTPGGPDSLYRESKCPEWLNAITLWSWMYIGSDSAILLIGLCQTVVSGSSSHLCASLPDWPKRLKSSDKQQTMEVLRNVLETLSIWVQACLCGHYRWR